MLDAFLKLHISVTVWQVALVFLVLVGWYAADCWLSHRYLALSSRDAWHRLQVYMYGSALMAAVLIAGFAE